ncbi:MAG TPA: uracil-DNA glycosylase [Steroidobacteraceae bacterium]|jgi:DNA polymerase
MLPERRRQYLETIGIDLWVRRSRPASADTPAAAPAAMPAETQAPARPVSGAGEPRGTATVTSAEVATQWQQLLEEVRACTLCVLHATRTQGVLGVGPKRADWLVIGEAPGAEEDRRGEPFVGAAGQLLDAMLRAIGLDRHTNVYIANVLKSRPPNNRDPRPEEVDACLPYLVRQIALLQPKIMLAVGRIAAQNLLGTDAPLGRLRGRVHHFGERQTPLVVTYHPAYLLRTPADKRKAWEDLKFARSVYQQLTQGAADGHRS